MVDLLKAVAGRLRLIFGEEYPLYYGRVLQGMQTPCFFIQPIECKRQVLPSGRVWRENCVEVHYYPQVAGDLREQTEIGERLLLGMSYLEGNLRNYRGRSLKTVSGKEFLRFAADYNYYTTCELEAAEKAEEKDLMELLIILPECGD